MIVEVHKVSKWYGQVIAVHDLSLTVEKGVVGLLGPNGAGKSTLMKMLVAQLRPQRGTVRIFDAPVDDPRAFRKVGYCPEHEILPDELTALEWVTALTQLHGFSRGDARARAEKQLGALGLGDAAKKRLGQFSKGMRQRAKLAQALAHDPELLILDEPTNGCDPLARRQVLDMIRARAKAGTCVLVSSHVLHEIEGLTSDILLIHKGRVVAEGDLYRLRELIDAHPHQVRVECDRPRELGRELIGLAHVARVAVIDGDGAVIIETREPDKLYPAVPEAAARAGALITSLTSPDNNLESVFRYLTDERK